MTSSVSARGGGWGEGSAEAQTLEPGPPVGLCGLLQLGPFPAEDVFLLSSRDRWTPLLYAVFSTSR